MPQRSSTHTHHTHPHPDPHNQQQDSGTPAPYNKPTAASSTLEHLLLRDSLLNFNSVVGRTPKSGPIRVHEVAVTFTCHSLFPPYLVPLDCFPSITSSRLGSIKWHPCLRRCCGYCCREAVETWLFTTLFKRLLRKKRIHS